ncbi:MAG: hypothetical protein ACXVLT_01650 [Flavisolibacter sp.]
MSPLLEHKYRYIVFEPVDSVRSQLKSVLKTPWYDISINLAGKVSNDNTFKLYPKLSLGFGVFGVVQSVSVITGKFETEGEQTNIIVEVRPNYAVLFAFYFILLIFLLKLVSLFKSNTESEWILVTALFVILVFIRSLIHFSMGRLKNRFERTMSVHPED